MNDLIEGTDIDITYSHWISKRTGNHIVLPPLTNLNVSLQGFQIKGSICSRIDFSLVKINNEIIFNDLNTGNKFIMDLSQLRHDKLSFSGQNSNIEIWERQPIESALEYMNQ